MTGGRRRSSARGARGPPRRRATRRARVSRRGRRTAPNEAALRRRERQASVAGVGIRRDCALSEGRPALAAELLARLVRGAAGRAGRVASGAPHWSRTSCSSGSRCHSSHSACRSSWRTRGPKATPPRASPSGHRFARWGNECLQSRTVPNPRTNHSILLRCERAGVLSLSWALPSCSRCWRRRRRSPRRRMQRARTPIRSMLSRTEVRATVRRTDALLASRRFPYPSPDWPAIPWPPF